MVNARKLAVLFEELDRDDLIDLLGAPCDAVPNARTYIDLYLSNAELGVRNALLAEAEKKIYQQFFTHRNNPQDPIKLREARKVVTEYGKLLNDTFSQLQLKLYYVEVGTHLTADYGDMHESFYNSLSSMFSSFFRDLKKHPELYEAFELRVQTILNQASSIGWGYHDDLVFTVEDFLAASSD